LGLLGLLSYGPTHIKSKGGIGVNMLITCPNCRTRYQLQPAQLGPGRNVSCSNCSHVWFADPRDALPDPAPRPMAPARPAPQAYPPQYMQQPPMQQQMYAQPQGAYAQPAPQMAPPPAPEPAPMPAPPPPEPADEPDPIPEPEMSMDMDEPEDMGVLPDDIDSMFEDDDDDIPPFESLINNDDEHDDLDAIDSPDQMEDPDYIPDVFSADEQEPYDDLPRKSPILKIIVIFFVLLIGGLVAGTFFFKDQVVAKIPALEGVFDMFGFHQIGEGLQIQRVDPIQETDQGLEVLVVRGQIENVDDQPRPVPMLRAILFDAEGHEIQHADAPPLKSELRKGEKMSFKIRIVEPSPLRRRMTVVFIDPQESGDAGGGHGAAPAAPAHSVGH